MPTFMNSTKKPNSNSAMPKYKAYFKKMLEENEILFAKFTEVHAAYDLDPQSNQRVFNEVGEKVQEVIRDYESRLCHHSEKGEFSRYTANLAEKFQAEVKKLYPKIDFIGISTSKGFLLKKLEFTH